MEMKLSVAMITFNEEKNLERTLNSIKDLADEIIIIDSGSTDKTKEIAEKFGAKFYLEPWKGYGKQRNSAIEKCSSEWVLNIDADEEISQELLLKIKEILNEPREYEVYTVRFASICFGKELKYGGWSNSFHIRLFKKEAGRYNYNVVHESFDTEKKIGKIVEKIYHHSYLTMEDYVTRFNRYTTEGAIDYYNKNKKATLFQIFLNPLYKFIRMYIFRLGFLDGIEGFAIANMSSLYTMVKYFKLREMYKNETYIKK